MLYAIKQILKDSKKERDHLYFIEPDNPCVQTILEHNYLWLQSYKTLSVSYLCKSLPNKPYEVYILKNSYHSFWIKNNSPNLEEWINMLRYIRRQK